MKSLLKCALVLCLFSCIAPACAEEVFVTTVQVHEDIPALSICVSDTGERDPLAQRENKLLIEISAPDGGFSQEIAYWSNETPSHDGAAALVRAQDMNFDGCQDLVLLTAMGARNVFFTVSLWNAEEGRFMQVMQQPVWNSAEKAFSKDAQQLELCNYELYPQERRIFSQTADGYRFSTEIVYEWEGKYGLAPQSVSDIYDAGKGMIGELVEMHGTQILRLWDEEYPEDWYYGQDTHGERLTSIRALTLEDAFSKPVMMEVSGVDWVNLRSLDSKDSPSLARLNAGTSVYLLKTRCGEDGGWVRVLVTPGETGAQPIGEHDESVGLTGYIWHSYLTYVGDSVSLPGER